MLVIAQKVVVDLRLVLAVHLEILIVDTRLLGNRVDALRLRSLCDFDITLHVDPSLRMFNFPPWCIQHTQGAARRASSQAGRR